ncbi:MAG: glycosyltransferase family 1 protein, partial [Chloroflexi bacterium]|nr:glycosyltransferase family 1 protein [Chloroflexota bacterium]
LLPPTDVEAWAAALRDLQTDPSKRAALAQQAKQDAAQYSWAARGNAIFRQSPA